MTTREDQETLLRWAFSERRISFLEHGHIEASIEGLGAGDVARLGSDCEVLEEYPDRPQGMSKLLLGYAAANDPVHVVVNVAAIESDPSEPVRIVTVYRPEGPKWRDERTRGVRE
jgi:hypothetical protein